MKQFRKRPIHPLLTVLLTGGFKLLTALAALAQPASETKPGYQGIWYFIGPTRDEYAYKYSGGLGTYPANHSPFAVYAPAVRKTFFCYGGVTDSASRALCHFVGVFDHRTKTVSRPTLLLDKHTDDAHDNPVLQLDGQGFIWVFSTSHGTDRPSFIHRSRNPYDASTFERIDATRLDAAGKKVPFANFSYFQSHYLPGQGFLALMTHYDRAVLPNPEKSRRTISFLTSADGVSWSAWQDLATMEEGHYQTSGRRGNRVGSAFNYHPHRSVGSGLDYRTNLYYVETDDFGKTWHAADGTRLTLPLTKIGNAALVQDYARPGLNVYINDVNFDAAGRPILFYLTSRGPDSGPKNGPYTGHVAHWTGQNWIIHDVGAFDHNYDMGSLYVAGKTWRIIAPLRPGPQPFGTGGELTLLESRDEGKTWTTGRDLTANSSRNHVYPRRPEAPHANFYAFWADGNARRPSASRLYFCNQRGDVFQLPAEMKKDWEKPVPVFRK